MKNLKLVLSITLVLGIIISASCVFAQDRPKLDCEKRFTEMDADKDGLVTLKEFKAVKHQKSKVEDIFRSKDINKDSGLSKEEFCAGKGSGQGKGK